MNEPMNEHMNERMNESMPVECKMDPIHVYWKLLDYLKNEKKDFLRIFENVFCTNNNDVKSDQRLQDSVN